MPARRASLQHSRRLIKNPTGWVLYLAHGQPVRLVVFVHGFGGQAVNTWQRFPEGGRNRAWWRDSDLLFVGYDSRRDNITGTAARLRRELPRFYPSLPAELMQAGEARVRNDHGHR